MPLFRHKNKASILFIHVPKTAGTSIEKCFVDNGWTMDFHGSPVGVPKVSPQHFDAERIYQRLGNERIDYSFSIVRNPYDRMESEYFYRTAMIKDFNQRELLNDFSWWVIRNLDISLSNPSHCDNHFLKQHSLIGSNVKIFLFEEGIGNIIKKISADIGSTLKEPPKKHKTSMRRPVEWSNQALLKFNDYYKDDFANFNYKMWPTKHSLLDIALNTRAAIRTQNLVRKTRASI